MKWSWLLLPLLLSMLWLYAISRASKIQSLTRSTSFGHSRPSTKSPACDCNSTCSSHSPKNAADLLTGLTPAEAYLQKAIAQQKANEELGLFVCQQCGTRNKVAHCRSCLETLAPRSERRMQFFNLLLWSVDTVEDLEAEWAPWKVQHSGGRPV